MPSQSDGSLNQRLQRSQRDRRNDQQTAGQGHGRGLESYRRAMLRDIADAAYARLLRNDPRPSDSQSPSNNESPHENVSGYESSDSERGVYRETPSRRLQETFRKIRTDPKLHKISCDIRETLERKVKMVNERAEFIKSIDAYNDVEYEQFCTNFQQRYSVSFSDFTQSIQKEIQKLDDRVKSCERDISERIKEICREH